MGRGEGLLEEGLNGRGDHLNLGHPERGIEGQGDQAGRDVFGAGQAVIVPRGPQSPVMSK